MGVISAGLRRICRPTETLRGWYESEVMRRNDFARNTRVFSSPLFHPRNEHRLHLYDSRSCKHFLVERILGDLILLVISSHRDVSRHIHEIANKYTLREISEGFDAYEELMRHLSRISKPPPPSRKIVGWREVHLLTYGTLTCNLACRYCNSNHVRTMASAGKTPKIMPLATAKRIIQFGAENLADKTGHVFVYFSLGGEPLLSFKRYRVLWDYCNEISQKTGVSVILNINTNGTVFTEEFIRHCEDNNVWMAISIDGPKDIHDSMRPFRSSKGSYDTIVNNLPRIFGSKCEGLNGATAAAVLTGMNPYPKRVSQHLIDLGFRRIAIKPVRDDQNKEWSLNAKTVEGFKKGYAEYAEWMLDCLIKEDDSIYSVLIGHDFFARYLIRFIRETKQAYRCEAGTGIFGVGMDGGLYPCDSFIRFEKYRLGDVFDGIDKDKQLAFIKDTSIDDKPVCHDCWARYLCGGCCYFSSSIANGNHLIPDPYKCELIRHCIELAIDIYVGLRHSNPVALERLCEAVFQSDSLVVTPLPHDS